MSSTDLQARLGLVERIAEMFVPRAPPYTTWEAITAIADGWVTLPDDDPAEVRETPDGWVHLRGTMQSTQITYNPDGSPNSLAGAGQTMFVLDAAYRPETAQRVHAKSDNENAAWWPTVMPDGSVVAPSGYGGIYSSFIAAYPYTGFAGGELLRLAGARFRKFQTDDDASVP